MPERFPWRPQLFSEFTRHFGDQIAVFHSGLSDGEKYDEWRRVKSGQARIVMGARSAVFMPLENLGLIIIDEEHETSYKAENHPPLSRGGDRPDAQPSFRRDSGAGQRHPSCGRLVKARLGIYDLVRMPERVRGLLLPGMQIVDMKKEFLRATGASEQPALSGYGGDAGAGRQALVFLNRRAMPPASSAHMRACADVRLLRRPPQISQGGKPAGLPLLRPSLPFSKTCRNAASLFQAGGTGTEQAEEQIRKFFPGGADTADGF